MIDHELCHCEVALDANGETKLDEQGRTCYRIRKHDIEEFKDVVSRHGVYTRELEEFARAGINDAKRNMLPVMEAGGEAESGTEGHDDVVPIHGNGKSKPRKAKAK